MATEPSAESIGTVSAVTGLPAAEAAKWLKVSVTLIMLFYLGF